VGSGGRYGGGGEKRICVAGQPQPASWVEIHPRKCYFHSFHHMTALTNQEAVNNLAFP
jgi:hypothetical protein